MAKKKSDSSEAKSPELQTVISSLKKKFGDDVIDWLSETKETEKDVIPSGSLALDVALGVGGFVRGRMYEIYGQESTGKSTLTYSTIKEAVKLGLKCAFIDAEHTLDKRLLSQMGANPENIIYIHGYTGEQNLDLAEAIIGTGQIALCVVDSVAALLPSSEANLESFDDQTMGVHARLMSRMCRAFVPLAARTNTTVLLINQTRNKIGGYGNPETTTGGNAIRFYATARIKVSGGHSKDSRILDSKGNAIGHRVTFNVVKNKLARPHGIGEADLIYGEGVDTAGEILDIALDLAIMERRGAWIQYKGQPVGQGRESALKKIREDVALQKELLGEINNLTEAFKTKVVVKEENLEDIDETIIADE